MSERHSSGRESTGPWQTLTCTVEDSIAVLTLQRPTKLNVMNVTMRDELGDCLLAIGRDTQIRALIVTGAGKAFSAGGDVRDFSEQSAEEMHKLMHRKSHGWFRTLWDLTVPTIAAVNGVAAGGGTNLVLACDIVVASESAQFGETFQKVGLMPDLGGLFALPRSVGLHRAKAMCLTGEMIDARRAHDLGVVHQIVAADELLARARELAVRLSSGPADAYAATKSLLNRSFELSMDELLQFELYAQSFLFSTTEHKARLEEFLHPARST